MKYWAYLLSKLLAGAGVASLLWNGLPWLIPQSPADLYYQELYKQARFTHDLTWTFAVMIFSLMCVGLVYLAIWDQRRRCRTCLSRLRMPVATGSWNHVLFIGPPRTEYICPYGHGTLQVPELQISGIESHNWKPNQDIWTELASLDKKE
jgi:hypothetical protein